VFPFFGLLRSITGLGSARGHTAIRSWGRGGEAVQVPLPVLAGRLRRRHVGYYSGYLYPGTRKGYLVRMVRLPEFAWVFGKVVSGRSGEPALLVAKASDLVGVEGFHPGAIRP
jgi:hypothetical protein